MSERYALITGTSSGLGLEMARSLLDQGYSVFGISRSGSLIEHSEYTDIVCDIRSEVSVEEMYDIIRETTEELHLIINNAAVFEMSLLQDTSSHEFTNHLTTNVLGGISTTNRLLGAVKFLSLTSGHFLPGANSSVSPKP